MRNKKIKDAIRKNISKRVTTTEINKYCRIEQEIKKLEDKQNKLYEQSGVIEKKIAGCIERALGKVYGGNVTVGKYILKYSRFGGVRNIKRK
jgi:hypothetical protein